MSLSNQSARLAVTAGLVAALTVGAAPATVFAATSAPAKQDQAQEQQNAATDQATQAQGGSTQDSDQATPAAASNATQAAPAAQPEAKDVATVNGESYDTLAKAIAAANDGDTVKLTADVTENVTIKKKITLDGTKTVDKNGAVTARYTITGAVRIEAAAAGTVVKNTRFEINKGVTNGEHSTDKNVPTTSVSVVDAADVTLEGNVFKITEDASDHLQLNGIALQGDAARAQVKGNTFDLGRFDFTVEGNNDRVAVNLIGVEGKKLDDVVISGNTMYSAYWINQKKGLGTFVNAVAPHGGSVDGLTVKGNTVGSAGDWGGGKAHNAYGLRGVALGGGVTNFKVTNNKFNIGRRGVEAYAYTQNAPANSVGEISGNYFNTYMGIDFKTATGLEVDGKENVKSNNTFGDKLKENQVYSQGELDKMDVVAKVKTKKGETKEYNILYEAFDAAQAGDTVTLTKDAPADTITVNKAINITQDKDAVFKGTLDIRSAGVKVYKLTFENDGTKNSITIDHVNYKANNVDESKHVTIENSVFRTPSRVVPDMNKDVPADQEDFFDDWQPNSISIVNSRFVDVENNNKFELGAIKEDEGNGASSIDSNVAINLIGPAVSDIYIAHNEMKVTASADSIKPEEADVEFLAANGNDKSKEGRGIKTVTVDDNTYTGLTGNGYTKQIFANYSDAEDVTFSLNKVKNAAAGIRQNGWSPESTNTNITVENDNTFENVTTNVAVSQMNFAAGVNVDAKEGYGTYFDNVAKAIEAAKDNDTVTLLKNTDENITLSRADVTLTAGEGVVYSGTLTIRSAGVTVDGVTFQNDGKRNSITVDKVDATKDHVIIKNSHFSTPSAVLDDRGKGQDWQPNSISVNYSKGVDVEGNTFELGRINERGAKGSLVADANVAINLIGKGVDGINIFKKNKMTVTAPHEEAAQPATVNFIIAMGNVKKGETGYGVQNVTVSGNEYDGAGDPNKYKTRFAALSNVKDIQFDGNNVSNAGTGIGQSSWNGETRPNTEVALQGNTFTNVSAEFDGEDIYYAASVASKDGLTTYYDNFAGAVKAAKAAKAANDGDTVTLLQDTAENVTVDKPITVTAAYGASYKGTLTLTAGATVKNMHFLLDGVTPNKNNQFISILARGASNAKVIDSVFDIDGTKANGHNDAEYDAIWVEGNTDDMSVTNNTFNMPTHNNGSDWQAINLIGNEKVIDSFNATNNTLNVSRPVEPGNPINFLVANGNRTGNDYGVKDLTFTGNTLNNDVLISDKNKVNGLSIQGVDGLTFKDNSLKNTYIGLGYSVWGNQNKLNNDIHAGGNDFTGGLADYYLGTGHVTEGGLAFDEADTANTVNRLIAAGIKTGQGDYPVATYTTVQAAVNAAKNNQTVTLWKNASENVAISKGKSVALDLAGHTLKGEDGDALTNNGELQLTDSSADKSGKIEAASDKVALKNAEGATATLKGGKLSATGEAYAAIYNDGDLTIEAPTYVEAEQDAIAATKDNKGSLTVNGGTFDGKLSDDLNNATLKGGSYKPQPQIKYVVAGSGTTTSDQTWWTIAQAELSLDNAEATYDVTDGELGEAQAFALFGAKLNVEGYGIQVSGLDAVNKGIEGKKAGDYEVTFTAVRKQDSAATAAVARTADTVLTKTATIKLVVPAPNKHMVKFESNGGSSVTAQQVDDGSLATEPKAPTKNGYEIAGWYTDANFGTQFNFATDKVTKDVTLYAKWTPKTYTISYDLAGGANNGNNPTTYTIESERITLQKPTRDGYKFDGWRNADGNEVTDIKKGSWGDIKLTATWQAVPYDITYDLDGGMNAASNPKTYTVEDDVQFAAPTKDGYTFTGWVDASGNPITHIAKGSMTGEVKLKATWKENPKVFTVTFDADGGSAVAAQKVNDGGKAIEPKDPTRDGFTFAGWYLNDTKYKFDSPVTGDVTLIAKWTRNAEPAPATHVVTFDTTGGSAVDQQKVVDGKTATKPADPTREGYTFAGWYADKDLKTPFDFTTAITANTIIYAKWTKQEVPQPKVYTVTFDADGGSAVEAQKVNDGGKAIEPKSPTKDGFTFAGWYLNGAEYDFSKPVTGDVTLVAKWTKDAEPAPATFSVFFDSNGGSDVATQTVEDGKAAAKPADPTRTGYEFEGWFSDSALTKEFDFNSAVKADTVLYAKWKVEDYKITYELDGGTNAKGNPASYTVESDFALSDPARDGYTFAGWFADKDFKVQVAKVSKGETGAKTFYAKWVKNAAPQPKVWSVTFNDGIESTQDAVAKVEDGKALTKPTDPVRDGYKFEGWFADSSLTKAYDFAAPVKGDVTVYAKWSVVTYKITYDLDGGVNAKGNPAEYTVETSTIKLSDPTRDGYTFKGWKDAKGRAVTEIAKGSTDDVALKATWEKVEVPQPKVFTVTFDTNGGSAVDAQKVNEGGKAVNPAAPTRDGYTFAGWFADEGLTTQFDFGAEVKADVTVYAKWTKNAAPEPEAKVYTVTFDTNGGSAVEAQKVNEGKTAVEPKDPSREGYDFAGWFVDEGLTKAYDFATPVKADVTVYAKWTEKKAPATPEPTPTTPGTPTTPTTPGTTKPETPTKDNGSEQTPGKPSTDKNAGKKANAGKALPQTSDDAVPVVGGFAAIGAAILAAGAAVKAKLRRRDE